MTNEAIEESRKMKKKKLWWEVWLDRLKVITLAGMIGVGATVTYKAWDAAELFKSAYGQVQQTKQDLADLDAGVTTQLAEIRKQMAADKDELRRKIDDNKKDTDGQMQKMYELQVQTLKEIKKL